MVKSIEDNWLHGERIPGSSDASSGLLDARGGLLEFSTRPHYSPIILNPTTGAVVKGGRPLVPLSRPNPACRGYPRQRGYPRHVR